MKNNEIDKTQTFKCYFFQILMWISHDIKIKNQQSHQKWYKVALKNCLENVRGFVNLFPRNIKCKKNFE